MATITSTELGASGRYIQFDDAAFDDLSNLTVLAYVRSTADPENDFGYLWSKTPTGTTTGPRFYYSTLSTNTRLEFGAHSATANTPSRGGGNYTFLNNWAHVACTWASRSITATNIKLYQGIGATISEETSYSYTTDGSGSAESDAANPLFLMNRYGLSRSFVGDIAYIAVWNRVLSLSELQTAQADGPLDVPTGLVLCWANDQDYSTNAFTPAARSTRVTGTLPPNTNLGGSADVTAPTLSSPTGTATGATTATGTVSTDEGNGTLYAVVTTSATAPTAVQVKAGQDHTGSAAVFAVGSGSGQAVSATGTQNVSATGLTAGTAYYWHYMHEDAASNQSSVSSSASFTTSAAVVEGVEITLYVGSTTQASLTGLTVLWWDHSAPTGAPDYETTGESTDASGVLSVDLSAVTTLSVGQDGFMLVYKADATDYRDSLVFASKLTVQDIS